MQVLVAITAGFMGWALAGLLATKRALKRSELPAMLRPLARTRGYALLVMLLMVSIAAGCAGLVRSWTDQYLPLNAMMPALLIVSLAGLVSGACLALLLQAQPR